MNSKEFTKLDEKSKLEYFRLWLEFTRLKQQKHRLQQKKKRPAAPVQK